MQRKPPSISSGVDERDAEFEVVEEPRTGLFGRIRGEARVRARVRPVAPRPKVERRGSAAPQRREPVAERAAGSAAAANAREGDGPAAPRPRPATASPPASGRTQRPSGARRSQSAGDRTNRARHQACERIDRRGDRHERTTSTVEEQAAIMRTFLDGLVDAFDLDATITDHERSTTRPSSCESTATISGC